jgi:hypothetical protein
MERGLYFAGGVYESSEGFPLTQQFSPDEPMQYPTPNLESIRRDIAERLRPTCANMSEEEFEKMVARMALIEWKHINDATPTSRMQSH